MFKKAYIAFLSLIFVCGLALLNNAPAFYGFSETKTAYTGSSSSQADITEFPCFALVNGIKGESCRISPENFSLDDVIKIFSAEIIKTERVSGVVSYYMRSPKFKNYATVGGEKINLHSAVGNGQIVMGTPLIYGGY